MLQSRLQLQRSDKYIHIGWVWFVASATCWPGYRCCLLERGDRAEQARQGMHGMEWIPGVRARCTVAKRLQVDGDCLEGRLGETRMVGFEPLSEDGSAYASLLRGEIFGFNCWCLLTYFVVLVFFLTMNSSTDCQPTSPVITAQGPWNKIYVAVKSTREHIRP